MLEGESRFTKLNGQFPGHSKMTRCKKRNEKRSYKLQLLCYWGKFLGINVFTVSSSKNMNLSYPSVIYVLFISSIYMYAVYFCCRQRSNVLLPGETPLSIIGDYAGLGFGAAETLAIWLSFVLRHNHVKTIINSLKRIETISRKVDLNDDYEKLFAKLGIVLIIVNCGSVIWGITSILTTPADNNESFPYVVLQLMSFNIVTIFVWIVAVMRRKFHRLNEKLTKFIDEDYGEKEHEQGSLEFISYSRSTSPWERIDAISQLHYELRDLMGRIEELFALIILMSTMKELVLIVIDVHIIYRFINERKSFTVDDFVYLIIIGLWAIIPMMIVAIIANVCGSTSEKANETANIFHRITTKSEVFRDNREIAKFNILSLHLLGNQVKMTLYGLIELDEFFVYRTIATATSYLTIMLQFYG